MRRRKAGLPGGYAKFERRELIGEGGHALVYRARDTELDRYVALKEFKQPISTAASREAFVREAQTAARLGKHPRIATVFESGLRPDNRPWIAMELFEHGSLARLLASDGPQPLDRVLHMGVVLAETLDWVHTQERPVLHRDVKSANVLIGDDGEPSLADFSVAWTADGAQRMTTPGLTPGYAAPEVVTTRRYTVAAEIWSLAATMCETATGRLPADLDTSPDPRRASAAPERMARLRLPDELPDDLRELLAAALDPDPENRPPDMARFASGLRAIQRSLPPGAHHRTQATEWARSLPLVTEMSDSARKPVATDRRPFPRTRGRRVALASCATAATAVAITGGVVLAHAMASRGSIRTDTVAGHSVSAVDSSAPPPSLPIAAALLGSDTAAPETSASPAPIQPQVMLTPGPAVTGAGPAPVVTPTSSAAGAPFYEPASRFEAFGNSFGTPVPVSAAGTRLTVGPVSTTYSHLWGAYLPGDWCSGQISFDVTVTAPTGSSPGYGFAVGPQDQISADQPAGWSLQDEWDGGQLNGFYTRPVDLPSGASAPGGSVPASDIRTSQHVTATVSGTSYTVTVGDENLGSFPGPAQCGGLVFRVWGGATAVFDHITVTS